MTHNPCRIRHIPNIRPIISAMPPDTKNVPRMTSIVNIYLS